MKPPIQYFGAKVNIAEQIVALMPAHRGYIEPFAGSLSILLAKAPAKIEVANDLDEKLINFWRVLRDRGHELMRVADLTPHAREELERAAALDGDTELELARQVWVLLTQGRSRTMKRTGWRFYADPNGTNASFQTYMDAYRSRILPAMDRLRSVSLECRPAMDVIAQYGAFADNLLYVDPPYLGTTRRAGRYTHEMGSSVDHALLASALTVTDMFAGAGGSSTGMMQIPGVTSSSPPPTTCSWRWTSTSSTTPTPTTPWWTSTRSDPRYFKKTDILWASPECTKWSQANGSDLPDIEADLFMDADAMHAANQSRLLMFDVLRYLEHHRYRRVIVENVVDIAVQTKYALAWQTWKRDLSNLGYEFIVVSLNSMHAQAHGLPAPQSRDRIYIIAWPKARKHPTSTAVVQPRAHCERCGVSPWMRCSRSRPKPRRRAVPPGSTYTAARACGATVEPGWLPAAAAIDWTIPGERRRATD
jgi:DNA adenine methylase